MAGLPRNQSVGVGLATMALAWAVYTQTCPRIADLRVSKSSDMQANSAEKTARWTAGAIVVGVAAITRDATVFIMGGTMVIALSWMHRQANHVDPMSAHGYAPTAPSIHSGDGMPSGVAVRS